MRTHATNERAVFAVVLAAGESRRFGRPKLLERLGGESLVARAARLARGCCGARSVLVTGAAAAEVVAAAAGHCEIVFENAGYRAGIGTSIALAARRLAPAADALLLMLADQAMIDAAHLERLMTAWSGAADEIVASAYAGIAGPPVLMPRNTFSALARLHGDEGARSVLQDSRFRLQRVPCEAAAIDVDTAADLETLRGPHG